MNKQNLMTLIAFVLLLFVIGKIALNELCEPTPNNPVVSAVSNALSPKAPLQSPAQRDPFSWDPIFQRLVQLLSKACTR